MDLLDRLHRRLLASWPNGPAGGEGSVEVTVGDLYQQLIPYRAIRTEFGAMELAEYEHALLRLLAGERAYAELTDPAVRSEIQRELAALNPILGIYRDYAEARVAVSLPEVSEVRASGGLEAAATREPVPPEARSGVHPGPHPADLSTELHAPAPGVAPLAKDTAPASGPHPADLSTELRAPAPGVAPLAQDTAPTSGRVPPACRSCRRDLPAMDDLLFCPFCGVDQDSAPCMNCGTALEASWRFCIRCGTPRD